MSNQIILLSCLILLLCCTETCKAQSKPLCNPSFCGSINISYPFRLRGDPPYCGHQDPSFVLECHDNQTILHLEPRTYHVQAITYSNFSIRVSDPGLDSKNYSSCPVYTSSVDDDPYSGYLYRDYGNSIYITFLNCLTPAANPSYIQNPFCGNTAAFSNTSRIYSYATIRTISLSDLEESCTFESVVTVSSPPPLDDHINYSYVQVHDMMAYGFQLTWYSVMCTECYEKGRSSCSLEDGKVVCSRYCDEHASLSERDFICKLDYYGVYLYFAALAIGALLVLRFIVGISCMIGLVVSKQRSSMDEIEINEELLKQQGALINYSYGEIKKMTNNFKAKLSEGPHGTVFRGKLRSGPCVAVKMLMNSSSKTSDKEFISYVSRISRISHSNIVRLIGICIKGAKRALVYELVQHGSLGQHILLQGEMKSKPCLSYGDMFKISVGTARGIDCLHSNQVFHLGIMPENILLDEGFNPKISDSEMSNCTYQMIIEINLWEEWDHSSRIVLQEHWRSLLQS